MAKIAVVIAVLALAGCAGTMDVEMPSNSGSGADEMRGSPCACHELDYDGRGYRWIG